MTPRDRQFLTALAARVAGLQIDPSRDYLVDSRLGPVARREGFASLADLTQAVRDRQEPSLILAVVEALGERESVFFQEPALIDHIAAEAAPELARRQGGPVRIWNAGCGAGQEIYSLAMVLAEQPSAGAGVELFASDLSARSLEKAQSGLYTQFEVQRGLSSRRLIRHFERRGELFALSPRVRQMVRWRRMNLVQDLPRAGVFDLILARRALAGLTQAARETVLRGFAAALSPHGMLVADPGETFGAERFGLTPDPGHPEVLVRRPVEGQRAA